MSCQHPEDVFCQYCLEKVQTEDSPPLSQTEKTMTPREKRNRILFDSALLSLAGAAAYFNTKFFLKTSVEIFDFSVFFLSDLLKTIGTREE